MAREAARRISLPAQLFSVLDREAKREINILCFSHDYMQAIGRKRRELVVYASMVITIFAVLHV